MFWGGLEQWKAPIWTLELEIYFENSPQAVLIQCRVTRDCLFPYYGVSAGRGQSSNVYLLRSKAIVSLKWYLIDGRHFVYIFVYIVPFMHAPALSFMQLLFLFFF